MKWLLAWSIVLALPGCDDSGPGMKGSGGAGGGGAGTGGSIGTGGAGGSAGGAGSGGSAGTTGTCDPVAQNCPASQRCTLDHTEPPSAFCETVPGTAEELQACYATATSDDCDRGLFCFGFSATSYCSRFCNQDADCAATGWCVMSVFATSLHVCMQRCQVIAQDCTQPGYACYLVVSTSGQQRQACLPLGSLAVDQSCTSANACQPGSICVASGGGHVCQQVCDPSAPACSAGTCHPYAGQVGLGTCY